MEKRIMLQKREQSMLAVFAARKDVSRQVQVVTTFMLISWYYLFWQWGFVWIEIVP